MSDRISPGALAKIAGDANENEVEASLRQYAVDGLLHAQRNYPEIVVHNGYQATVVGKAGPDWTCTVAPMAGRTVHLEVKTFKAKNRRLYKFIGDKSKRRRRLQYQTMCDAVECGALAYYLVCWRYKDTIDWRLYPVWTLDAVGGRIAFEREAGIAVAAPDGWPDWLAAIT